MVVAGDKVRDGKAVLPLAAAKLSGVVIAHGQHVEVPEGVRFYDTLTLAKVVNPDRDNSIEAWADELGVSADPLRTPELIFKAMISAGKKYDIKQALAYETRAADILDRQAEAGVAVCVNTAEKNVRLLDRNLEELWSVISKNIPEGMKHGDIKSYIQDKLGWKPTIWNGKWVNRKWVNTSPKFTDDQKMMCPDLARVAAKHRWIKDLLKWRSLRHRRSFILTQDNKKGLLNDSRVLLEERVSAIAMPLATNTGRCKHKGVVNVPNAGSLFGKEMRSMFIAGNGKKLVGADAKGLENAILAHYIKPIDSAYSAELMRGDIHSRTAEALQVDRDTAKRIRYAILYGASHHRVVQILGCSEAQARKVVDNFWKANAPVYKLKQKLERYFHAHGHIKGLDGRPVPVRSKHSLLNALLQSGGAIFMTYAMVEIDKLLPTQAQQVLFMHDEFAYEVDEDLVRTAYTHEGRPQAECVVVDHITAGFAEARKVLGLRVYVSADCKIGNSWSGIH